MSKSICKYCGHYIEDIEERCPNCGAPNENHLRVTHDTPKTIEELKSWYKEKKLPPETVTRFFIGKNVDEPKVFGIYEENGKFILYKNDSDGNRVVSYEGDDELYAVNEYYIRLKEEILNQKTNNLKKKEKYLINKEIELTKTGFKRLLTHPGTKMIGIFVAVTLCLYIVIAIVAIMFSIYHDYTTPRLWTVYNYAGQYYYYDGYNDKGYDWYIFDEDINEWVFYAKYENESGHPDGLSLLNDRCESGSVGYNLKYKYPLRQSKDYIDLNNISRDEAYYLVDGILYYNLAYYYSDSDYRGWYVLEDGEWKYLCKNNEHDLSGDELWYNSHIYKVSDSYKDTNDYMKAYFPDIEVVDFSKTIYYKED